MYYITTHGYHFYRLSYITTWLWLCTCTHRKCILYFMTTTYFLYGCFFRNTICTHPIRKNTFRSRTQGLMCIVNPLHTMFPSFLKLGTMFSSFLIFDTVNDTVNLFSEIRHKKRGLKITLLICWVGSLPPLVFNVVHFFYKELWYLM